MPYPADFAAAHHRHWTDGERLWAAGRYANADQLYGFSAECGLKAVMRELGMPVDPSGVPEQQAHKKHVHELWSIFQSFVEGRGGARYLSHLPTGAPFADWSHHDRYANDLHFDEPRVRSHREAANAVRSVVDLASGDGLL